jgi:hypothetical protein
MLSERLIFMKKLFAFIIVFSLVFLPSCSAKTEKSVLRLPLKIKAHLLESEAIFTADITENGCNVTFEKPDSLKSVKLEFRKDGCNATVGDFSREVKPNLFPAQKSFIDAIVRIALSPESRILTDQGEKYTIDETVIMVYYNEDKSVIERIETEESGRRFSFDVVGLELYEAQS